MKKNPWTRCLQEHFETFVPYGYEDGCGGFGDVILNALRIDDRLENSDRAAFRFQPFPNCLIVGLSEFVASLVEL
jgi:hypothetical protein